MVIEVVSGSGSGRTEISAFDSALKCAGVYNYNLIYLSSIIPKNCEVIQIGHYREQVEKYGHRLYVVQAKCISRKSGQFVAAGLGWYQTTNSQGLFVEHELEGDAEDNVRNSIRRSIYDSLEDLCAFREIHFDEENVNSLIVVSEVIGQPKCALVIAVYKSEPWE